MGRSVDWASLDSQRRDVLTSDGVRLSVIDVGRGAPVVFLSAWSNAAVEYWRQVIEFAGDHRVIAIDMRGHGESEKIERGYHVCRLAADLQDVLTDRRADPGRASRHLRGGGRRLALHVLREPGEVQRPRPGVPRRRLDNGMLPIGFIGSAGSPQLEQHGESTAA